VVFVALVAAYYWLTPRPYLLHGILVSEKLARGDCKVIYTKQSIGFSVNGAMSGAVDVRSMLLSLAKLGQLTINGDRL